MRSKITRSLLVAAATTSLLGLHAAPASADTAPNCRYQDCTGQMPEAAGCDGDAARPLASFWSGDTLIELRYSSACEAAWGRVTSPGESLGGCSLWTDKSVVRIEGYDWRGSGSASFDGCSSGDQAWTAMVGFDYNVRACYIEQAGATELYRGCTAWN